MIRHPIIYNVCIDYSLLEFLFNNNFLVSSQTKVTTVNTFTCYKYLSGSLTIIFNGHPPVDPPTRHLCPSEKYHKKIWRTYKIILHTIDEFYYFSIRYQL